MTILSSDVVGLSSNRLSIGGFRELPLKSGASRFRGRRMAGALFGEVAG